MHPYVYAWLIMIMWRPMTTEGKVRVRYARIIHYHNPTGGIFTLQFSFVAGYKSFRDPSTTPDMGKQASNIQNFPICPQRCFLTFLNMTTLSNMLLDVCCLLEWGSYVFTVNQNQQVISMYDAPFIASVCWFGGGINYHSVTEHLGFRNERQTIWWHASWNERL